MISNIIKKLKSALPFITALLICVITIILINNYVIATAIVVGDSMNPTFSSGNIILINKITNHYNRFDVVIIELPEEIIIKRIIGTPGDTVHIRNGQVFINEEALDDVITEYIDFSGLATIRVRLGEGEYFVLGDNRSNSKDSRYPEVGIVKEEQIIARAMLSIVPPKMIK